MTDPADIETCCASIVTTPSRAIATDVCVSTVGIKANTVDEIVNEPLSGTIQRSTCRIVEPELWAFKVMATLGAVPAVQLSV